MTPMILQCRTRYVIDRVLGRGGMAEVLAGRKHLAEGVSLPVAIKRIRPDYSKDDRFHDNQFETMDGGVMFYAG